MINLLPFSRICYHEFSVYKYMHTSTMACSIQVHVYSIQVHKCIQVHVVLITSRITITYCVHYHVM